MRDDELHISVSQIRFPSSISIIDFLHYIVLSILKIDMHATKTKGEMKSFVCLTSVFRKLEMNYNNLCVLFSNVFLQITVIFNWNVSIRMMSLFLPYDKSLIPSLNSIFVQFKACFSIDTKKENLITCFHLKFNWCNFFNWTIPKKNITEF